MAHQSITQAFVIAWDEAIRHAAQQSESRLLGTVINKGNVEGESFTHNYLGTTEMDEVVDRLGDTEWGAVEHKTPIALISRFLQSAAAGQVRHSEDESQPGCWRRLHEHAHQSQEPQGR